MIDKNQLRERKVGDLKDYIKTLEIDDMPEIWIELQQDPRQSVKKLGESLKKTFEKHHKELQRLDQMMVYERDLYEQGYEYICGIDEVGRGPLAGPVVVSAVILPINKTYLGINDSKKVSEKNRIRLTEEIKSSALAYALGEASPEEIDEINILNATKLAMKRAVEKLDIKPDFILIDAVELTDIDIKQRAIIKGDEKSVTIAAASIIAKVARDAQMVAYASQYPQYGFESNKGYGTQEHILGLKNNGATEIHRKSFIKNLV